MKDNVEMMTKIFYYAMTFEKYERIWLDAWKYTNSLIASKQDKVETAEFRIENSQSTINNIDKDYDKYRDNAKKEIKKWTTVVSIILIFFVVLVVSVILCLNEWFFKSGVINLFIEAYAYFGIYIQFIAIGLGIYAIYIVRKKKSDLATYTNQKIEQTKAVSANNIEACKVFIKKTNEEIAILESKREFILIQLGKAKSMKDKIYGLGLIPSRYTGIVPVATMYGYLVNGICTIIRGHGGVYERYENDIKLGFIIQNLVDINKKLDVVIKNQEKLYNLMGDINSTLGNIKREIEYGNKMMSEIKSDSSIIATASTQSAVAENYLATHVWRNS